eukprot:sb/3472358/
MVAVSLRKIVHCAVHPSFIALLNQGLQEMYGVTLEDGGDMDCIDQDENCRHWTSTIQGVCQTDEYVKRSCERSCRTCEEIPLTCSDVQRMLNRGRQGFVYHQPENSYVALCCRDPVHNSTAQVFTPLYHEVHTPSLFFNTTLTETLGGCAVGTRWLYSSDPTSTYVS